MGLHYVKTKKKAVTNHHVASAAHKKLVWFPCVGSKLTTNRSRHSCSLNWCLLIHSPSTTCGPWAFPTGSVSCARFCALCWLTWTKKCASAILPDWKLVGKQNTAINHVPYAEAQKARKIHQNTRQTLLHLSFEVALVRQHWRLEPVATLSDSCAHRTLEHT